jgi:hypothetical protein
MRDLLYDLHRADGAIQVAGYNYSHDEEVAGYYKNVLDKHGVTQAQFDSSLVWFTDNPQIFNKIYPKVVARLDAEYEAERQRRDAQRKLRRAQKNIEKIPLRPLYEVKQEWQKGYDIPWKEWQIEEFYEKNVVIFGQLEKK